MIQFPDSLENAPVMQIVGPALQEWRHILDHHLYTNVFGQIETMQLIVPAAVVDVDVDVVGVWVGEGGWSDSVRPLRRGLPQGRRLQRPQIEL